MRLVALGPASDGRVRAALEIEPAPGWITYWREPGEGGIPPQITLAPDSNLTLEGIGFPTPKPISAGTVHEIGYDAPVALPLDLRIGDISRPGKLDLTAFIGLCKDICIPFQAAFALPVSAADQTSPAEALILDAADAALPQSPSDDFAVTSHALSPDGHDLSLSVRLPDAGTAAPQVYVTGPSGYVFFTQDKASRDGRDFQTHIAIGKLPKTYNIHGKHWSVLIVDGQRAIETTLAFD